METHNTHLTKYWYRGLLVALLSMALLAVAPTLSLAEPEDIAEPVSIEFVLDEPFDVSLDEPLDNDALFNAYVEQILEAPLQGESNSEDIPLTAQTVPLEGIDGTLYAKLRTLVNEVASGIRTNTKFSIPVTDLLETTQWNAADLGVSSLIVQGDDGWEFSSDAIEAVRKIVNPHLNLVLAALIADCPYDLYWLKNTQAITMNSLTISSIYVGDELYMTVATKKDSSTGERVAQYLEPSMRVSDDYAISEFEVNSDKVQYANTAVLTAESIVNETSGLAPYDRLREFMNRICGAVTYNQKAVDEDWPYGDPWQLISVFDGDESTNVVCEGYSKAFKYLCDLADMSGVTCRLVSGRMQGRNGSVDHMWNVVQMPDGRNYLVDVTNCDENSIGSPDLLFIATPESGTYTSQYEFSPKGVVLTYSYDEETLGHFESSELTLSSTAYDPSSSPDEPTYDLADAVVTAADQVYSGTDLTPEVTVTWNESTLQEGTDYTLSVENGAKVGTATVTVSGLGNFQGTSATTTYHITADMGYAQVTNVSDVDYSGEECKQSPTVDLWNARLVLDTDYTLSYESNTNAGTATVIITGQGNYVGSKRVEFTINALDLSGATLSSIPNQTLENGAPTPSVTVTLAGKELVKGTDYELEYQGNEALGVATVYVQGTGNYTGETSTTFNVVSDITLIDLSEASVNVAGQTYTGAKLEPEVTVTLNGAELVRGTDYMVEYADNVNAGPATATVTGMGGYTGTASGTFTIAPRSIAQATVESIADKTYTGSAIKPVPTVMVDGVALKNGVDFAVTWTNNVNVGTAKIAIVGKGNYTGSVSEPVSFKITKASIANTTVSSIPTQKYDGTAKKPAPTVKLGSTTLKNGTDYALSWNNNIKAGTARLTITGKGNCGGTKFVTFKIATMAGTWKKSGGRWWYQWKDGTYPKSVFLDISGSTYCFDSAGWMLTGWRQISNKWYYFGSSGAMVKDEWVKSGSKWYYLKGDGAMATGWLELSGKRYYLDSSGRMVTGWRLISNKWYYFRSSGAMVKGEWVGNYYLQADGTMATNKWIGKYHVGADGKWDKTK